MKWAFFVSLHILSYVFIAIFVVPVYSQQFQSPGYRIESGSLIVQPELEQSSANHDATASFGADVQKKFEETGYVVIEHTVRDSIGKPFVRLRLDKSQLVFDTAEVRGESVQKSTVKLSGSGATNFMITLRLEEQFKNSFGATIPPTFCDKESSKCTPVLAKTWKKAFGFGYRAVGTTSKDFSDTNSYRPLFVGGLTGMSAVIFDDKIDSTGKELDLQFKLRPQPQTQTGIYNGTVIITASADY